MQRNRLKNIINKSKTLNQKIEPFDAFKKSLPKEIEIGDNYRLEAAWKAYGSPKNYQEALWEGMIQPIDENTFKLPSIGYNEETDEYEYLNKGRENETVDKDIRVWDNDIIPFVKELKHGGYVRTFNEEKDCWTYSKNSQKREDVTQTDEQQVIEEFKQGGKSKRSKTDIIIQANQSGVPFMQRILNNDQRKLDLGNGKYGTHILNYDTYNGKTYVYPEIQVDPAGNLWHYKEGTEAFDRAIENNNVLEMTPEEAEWFVNNYKWFYPNYFGRNPYPNSPQTFKQGGQMNVIPEGALHARKNNMELAKEGEVTHKGIPVVDNEGNQTAEVEKEEWTMTKELTEAVEEWCKKYYDEETSQKEKDELAIKCGKRICKELLHNTDDRAGLIERMEEEL